MIADELEAVAAGRTKRLMIFMPPRHGKSELASRRFPAYFMGRHPERNMIAASYNSDLAGDFGREVRNIVGSREYRALFSSSLAADSSAANRWHTDRGGSYVAAGVGTATTGRGAHVLLIDDPVKDREDADSDRMRERAWRWYTSTAYTRLESDVAVEDVLADDWLWRDFERDIERGVAERFEGAIVLIQTRWHDDDLAGRLLAAMAKGGEHWKVLELPAIRETADGQKALWPAKYPLARLEEIRKVIGTRDWSALYQQRPAPDEGAFFKRDWFRTYDKLPAHLRFYGASDYAVTDKGGDYTVHVVIGIDPDDNIYVVDLWRGQTESDRWVDAFIDLAKARKPLKWAEESGQIVKSLGPFIAKRMKERKCYVVRQQFTSASDKPTRSRSFQARASMGQVYLPADASWLTELVAELLQFPTGRHDDQVDALSLIGRMLDEMIAANVPRAAEKAVPPDYMMNFEDHESYRTV